MTQPVCVIVGVGQGLGLALARRFAQGDGVGAGMRVAALARGAANVRRCQDELRAEGLDVTGIVADAGDPAAMDAAFARIDAELGACSVLVYNAAIIEPARFVTTSSAAYIGGDPGTKSAWRAHGVPADFAYLDACFRTNVAGALHAAQLALPGMRARGAGTILLTGGVLAFDPWLEWGVTALGKAALRSLGLSLDRELRGENIHVCTVAIHGTMEEGTPYTQPKVAEAYWKLHKQAPADWEPELHFRGG